MSGSEFSPRSAQPPYRNEGEELNPLPYADFKKYRNELQRQADLGAAEKQNIASAAEELGMTPDEWQDLRKELGRSPRRSDLKK